MRVCFCCSLTEIRDNLQSKGTLELMIHFSAELNRTVRNRIRFLSSIEFEFAEPVLAVTPLVRSHKVIEHFDNKSLYEFQVIVTENF